jgi:hypothetical protein
MSNVSQIRRAPRSRPEPLFLFDARRPAQAATPDMIAQVITHADQATHLSGGRLKLRISRQMIEILQAKGRLGPADARLADLTVTWDEAQGEVVQVRDDARLRDASARWAEWDALWDEESYASEPQIDHAVAA